MDPITEVRQISAIAYGFMASKALFAALELDLFSLIEAGTDDLATLSEATGIAGNRLRSLMTALAASGLVSEHDGRFRNAPATSRFLVGGAPGEFRDYVRVVNGAFGYESFRHLLPALRGEPIFTDRGFYEGMIYAAGIGGEAFSAAQHAGSLGPARMMAGRLALEDCTSFLDVGGGSGAYTIAFCTRFPKLRATILDFPATLETARRMVAEAGLADRVAHVAGNAIETDWPAGQDVILMSYLWSAVGEVQIRELAERAYRAASHGGSLLIHDFMVHNSHDGPDHAAWYLLGSILDNPGAVCLSPGYVEGVLRAAGFEIEGTEEMLPAITMLTRARKPAG